MKEDVVKCFAILDEMNVVVNIISTPINNTINIQTGDEDQFNPENIISTYAEGYKIKEYSVDDDTITKNPASIGYIYESSLNAFIPPQPDDTYILDIDNFTWYPNPELEYDLNEDGIKSKWIPETNSWKIVE